MVAILLSALTVSSILLDGYLTERRLKISSKLELNPLVRKLAEKFGAREAALLGVVTPQGVIAASLALFAPKAFLVFLGALLYRELTQVASLKLENHLALHV